MHVPAIKRKGVKPREMDMTHRGQFTVLFVRRLPYTNRPLPHKVEECVCDATPRQSLDLSQLYPHPFRLDAYLATDSEFDSLASQRSSSETADNVRRVHTPFTAACGLSGAPGGIPG